MIDLGQNIYILYENVFENSDDRKPGEGIGFNKQRTR